MGIKLLVIIVAVTALTSYSGAKGRYGVPMPVFPVSSQPEKTLLHIDLMQASLEERFAMTVLQGLANREKPRIYISQNPEWHGPACFELWKDDLRSRGFSFTESSPERALIRCRNSVKGAVIYESGLEKDPQSLHKINALTLYCAIESLLPVTEELNERLKLPVVYDSRGKYLTPDEAYGWVLSELKGKANNRIVAHTAPTHMVLRDYLVQHKIPAIWISKGMSAESDAVCQKMIWDAEPNGIIMGCWGGYGEQPAGRYSEADLQRIASLHGKFVVVTDGCFNTSVFSGLGYKRSALKRRTPPKLDRSKAYVVFHITDGDNLQWLQQEFVTPKWWLDPNRGKVPISWSISPNAADLIPNFLEYIEKTASENDEFTCPTGGLGLLAPSIYGGETGIERKKLLSEYLRACNAAMIRTGQVGIHLGDTSGIPWTRADFDLFANGMPAVKAILGDYGKMLGVFKENADYRVSRGVPVIRTLSGVKPAENDDERAKTIADGVRANRPNKSPAFIHVCLINWYVNPTSIMKAAELLGEDYVVVLPSEMADLYREACK